MSDKTEVWMLVGVFAVSYVMSPPVCMSRILIISYMLKNAQMHEESPVTDWEKKRVRMRMVNEYGLWYMNLFISFYEQVSFDLTYRSTDFSHVETLNSSL